VDAAATTSSDRRRLALTLVNRSPDQPETAEIVLRDLAFDGAAEVRSLTAEHGHDARTLPDVEGTCLEEGSEKPSGQALILTLPPRSFTVVEAATASP
jgi:alpha-L-arabinofuranosidase